MSNLPRIVWAKLTPEAVSTIKDELDRRGGMKFDNQTLKPDQYLHHVTLLFKPTVSQMEDFPAKHGDKIKVRLIDRCWSTTLPVEAITAVPFINGNPLHFDNRVLHITVSTDGLPPVRSNDLLMSVDDGFVSEKFNMEVEAVIEFIK
jgi:hypothetical protein